MDKERILVSTVVNSLMESSRGVPPPENSFGIFIGGRVPRSTGTIVKLWYCVRRMRRVEWRRWSQKRRQQGRFSNSQTWWTRGVAGRVPFSSAPGMAVTTTIMSMTTTIMSVTAARISPGTP